MLPRFTVALPQDALLQSTPPFDFPGVSMRVFPLRADMTRVQSLVDGWINAMLPPEIAYYRVFAPYVTLVALNYGRAAVIPSNLGWSSQKELTFSIPVQWYRRTRRGFELQDFAVLTPFIFVDNDLSIPAGREVFGWQKNLIWMDPLGDRWLSNPRAPMKHAGISTRAFREVYAGKQEQPMPFVAIDEAPSGASLQYPADRQNPLLPWVALANAMDAAGGLAQDMVELLAGLGVVRRRRVPLRDGRTALLDPGGSPGAALRTLLRSIDPLDPDLYANEINVKQFRDAEHPTTACYQDVNNTVMRIQEVNRLGILGETRVLLGDITGGYRITLHQWESLPVADMLGLEAARSTEVDGATIVSLKPVLPMWADMDLLYAEERHVIAWRSKDHPWTPGPGAVAPARQRDAPREKPNNQHSIPAGDAPSRKPPKKIPYNTTLGSSSPVIYGPFETPKATLRVLPLLASERRLGELVDRALNEPLRGGEAPGEAAAGGSGYSFSPWGRYVYLVVTTADETYSVDNNIGSWPSRSVRFLVPVRRFLGGQPDGFALYCPFAFSGSTLDSVSSSEINGMAVMGARIDSPSSTWLDEGGPAVGRGKDLAVLRAMIPPILDAGERARTRTILRVSQRGTDRPDLDEEELNPHWAPRIKRDLERRRGAVPKVPGALHHRPDAEGGDGAWTTASDLDLARAHAVDLLGDQGPIPFVMLKQFRDVARPDRACYRALVEVEQRLVHVERIEEITGPLEVTIFDYESMPIARVLGLVHRSSGYHKGLRCRKMEPVRPFWVTAMIREELGKNLAEQRRDLSWVRPTAAAPPEPVAPERVAAPGAWSEAERLANLSMLDLGKPRNIGRLLTATRGKQSAAGMSQPDDRIQATTESAMAAGTSPSEAAAATRAIGAVEPQWILESLLSREWESRSSPVWLHHEREIERAAAEARGGVKALTEQALGEIKELVAQRRKVTANTHHDILEVIDSHLLPRYVALAWISAEARHLNELAFARRTAPAGAAPLPSGFAAGAAVMHDVLHFADDGPPDSPPPPPPAEPPATVGALYDQSEFDKLENEEPEILRLAEGVLGRDVAVGGLIKTILDLCGGAAGRVIDGYSAHPPQAPSATVAGSPQDLFLHFAGGDEEPGSPANEALPEGLVDDLSKGATATLATARSLVYLAWKTAAEEPDGKHAKWVSFVGDAAREVDAAREALILALAKCWQKPFFCVRRDTAGPEEIQDELFPRGRCWSDRHGVPWYSPTEE